MAGVPQPRWLSLLAPPSSECMTPLLGNSHPPENPSKVSLGGNEILPPRVALGDGGSGRGRALFLLGEGGPCSRGAVG